MYARIDLVSWKEVSMSLSSLELERYERQMPISGWGAEGQRKLKSAKAAVVGIGGLGCPTSIYLTAVGVGRVILIDKGKFKLDNLNRQILCSQRDVGKFKAEVAKEKLEALNSKIEIEAVVAEITKENADNVIEDVDVVVDGQDNWKTRFIINEYCVTHNIPFIHAGVSALHGQITTIMPSKGPCLRCIFPKDPPEVEKIPVLGATPACLASLQVVEAVKIITGIGKPLVGRMLFVNGEEMVFDIVEVKRNMECPVCGNR
jgi:molybdopterin/thiamine biosynthesis adenylyltransferase